LLFLGQIIDVLEESGWVGKEVDEFEASNVVFDDRGIGESVDVVFDGSVDDTSMGFNDHPTASEKDPFIAHAAIAPSKTSVFSSGGTRSSGIETPSVGSGGCEC
jgi:hypothetical protein